MPRLYAVIMAGGRGERFWPLSTDSMPKPFIPLLGPRTLIQQTVERLLPLLPPGRMFISIGEAHREIAGRQLPQIPPENFIVEPVGRDTAACLGFCALHIERRDPDGSMVAVPADHYIADAKAYCRTLEKGVDALPRATGVVFGIRPNRPETGYGYIQVEPPGSAGADLSVLRFVEKPDAVRAREYVAAGSYYWNSGIFLWRNRTLLALLHEHMPELYLGLDALRSLIGRDEARAELQRIFVALPRISIDFGVAEKTSGLRLVPAEFAWDDIGNWGALERALPHDDAGNVALGQYVALDARGCITYSDAGTIATFGVSDLIVVQALGKVLVCPKDRAAELKRLIAALGPDGAV
jgi:mannose-1-phosphate guanylyltransferase